VESAPVADDRFHARGPVDRAIALATKRSCTGRQLLATEAKRDKPRLEHEARPERRAGLLGRRSGVDARRSRSIATGQAGRVRRRGGQDRSGRRRVASMASRTLPPGLHRHRRCRSTASPRSRPGRFVRTTLRPSHSTSFIVCVPSSVTELADTTWSSVLARPHKSHPVACYLTRYAAARKLSAPPNRKDPSHDA
jgi:hypothetical protein